MILNKILSDIDDNWSIIEKARYIYVKIGKEIRYDDRFSYSTNQRLLEQIYYKKVSIDEDIDPRIVCRTANVLFEQLMNRKNIKCKKIYKKNKNRRIIDVDDVACLFYDENGNEYFTNIVGDIENCKYGLKTVYFGNIKNEYDEAKNVKEILPEKLFEIDKKIGLIKQEYSDIVLELLKDEVKNTNNFKNFLESKNLNTKNMSRDQILRYKIMFLNEYIKFRDSSAGTFEKRRFYQALFKCSALDKFDKRNFETFEYIKEEGEKIDIILLIGINLYTKPTYFYYSDKHQSYINIERNSLKDLLKGYRSSKKDKDILNFNKYINVSDKEII